MCRSKAQGGRRCKGKRSGVTAGRGVYQSAGIPVKTTPGLFDVLTDEYRNELRSKDINEVAALVTQLRDRIDVDRVVNSVTENSSPEEKRAAVEAVSLLGDVTLSWVEGQTVEQEAAAAVVLSNYRHAFQTAEAAGGGAFVTMAFAEYAPRLDEAANNISEARYSAIRELLSNTVGTGMSIDPYVHEAAPEHTRRMLKRFADVTPDSWKKNVEQRCGKLNIFAAKERGVYFMETDQEIKYPTYEVCEQETAAIAATVTNSLQVVPVQLPGDDYPQPVKLGGRADDPYSRYLNEYTVAQMNRYMAERKVAGKLDIPDDEFIEFESAVTDDGRLTVIQKRVTLHDATYEGNVLQLDHAKPSTVMHEMSHRMQHGNPHLWVVEKGIIDARRGAGEPETTFGNDGEPVIADEFAHIYFGKYYPQYKVTESLATGMEVLFEGTYGAGSGVGLTTDRYARPVDYQFKVDRRHIAATVGLLASATKV